MTLLEPDVSLTDLALAGECGLFSALLRLSDAKQGALRGWFVLFFAATGVAALLGAIAHGFVADTASTEYRLLWLAILGAIGTAAVASWAIGARLALSSAPAKLVTAVAIASFSVYLVIIILMNQSFAVAVVYYLPAAFFLLVALMVAHLRASHGPPNPAAAGVLLTFIGAYIQQAQIALPSLHLSHNALYHIVQALALLLIFLGAMQLIRPIARVRQQ